MINFSPVRLPSLHPFVGMDVASFFGESARRRGSHPFLIWEPPDGLGRQWTYDEFFRDVEDTASGLATRGVGPGDAVILHLDNSPGFLAVWFACARLGAIAVDVNTQYVEDELAHAVALTHPVGIVTDPRLGLADGPAATGLSWVAQLDTETGTVPGLLDPTKPPPERNPDPAAPLCVQLTSGTTSRPKAVLYTHANLLWAGKVGVAHTQLQSDDVQLIYAPLFHTQALCWQLFPTLWAGGTIVLIPKYSASRFWEISLRHGCTRTNLLGLMMRTLSQQEVPEHQYRSWSIGLEMADIERRYRLRIFSGWGMTEVVSTPIHNEADYPVEESAIGRASAEYPIRVVDELGKDVAAGETGDLLVGGVRGLSLFAEYVNDPAATDQAFDGAFFRTGDRVTVLRSGAIKFHSRAKDMLKVGGENVAAAEIERVIAAVPGVSAVAVVGQPDPMRDEVPCAFVTLSETADANTIEARILAHCESFLATFKVPKAVYIVDELPVVLMGKIAKGQLRQWAVDRMSNPVL
jgi:carnitine-CoA ligase